MSIPIPDWLLAYLRDLAVRLHNPWVWFGIGAQTLFFLRFFYQWLVSERQGRSTIPIGFWYLSLAGALSTFVYAAGQRDPAIMLGQLPACLIYLRNLTLIYSQKTRRRRAGLPDAIPAQTLADGQPESAGQECHR